MVVEQDQAVMGVEVQDAAGDAAAVAFDGDALLEEARTVAPGGVEVGIGAVMEGVVEVGEELVEDEEAVKVDVVVGERSGGDGEGFVRFQSFTLR